MSAVRAGRSPRRGAILLIVLALLTLFLVLGLAFVFYAQDEASAARIYRESQSVTDDRADVPPQTLLDFALGQLIYDVPDHGDHVYSAMRGHSLARTMYGWNYRLAPQPGPFDPARASYDAAYYTADPAAALTANQVAYNGVGPLRTPFALGGVNYANDVLVNYQPFAAYRNGRPTLADGFLRDPERFGPRTSADQRPDGADFAGGFNVPYTFPDRTSMFLAAVRADPERDDPAVLRPSFFRPFRAGRAALDDFDPTNPFWTDASNPAFKYLTLRPRPADMYFNAADPADPRNFPRPADRGGDVSNLGAAGFAGGGNDSFWMDLNYPVTTTRTGKKFKPLFAFLVTDLDNKLNVNVHGNVRAGAPGDEAHASHQGVGKGEVNLSRLLDRGGSEWRGLFFGRADAAGTFTGGRYGTGARPQPGDNATAAYYPAPRVRRSYTDRVDSDGVEFDAASGGFRLSQRLLLPGGYHSYPDFAANAGYDDLASPAERLRHPWLYNAVSPVGDDAPFGMAANLYYLLGTARGPNHTWAELNRLIPANLASVGRRMLLTTHSHDLDVPGMSPAVNGSTYQFRVSPPALYPAGANASVHVPSAIAGPDAFASDFSARDGRAKLLSRIDLNRRLAPYLDGDSLSPIRRALADADRRRFATDILDRLILATGADRAAVVADDSDGRYRALRWLAQLAVNVVDFIDEDDAMTPLDWRRAVDPAMPLATGREHFVFGTEAPRVLINEAYAEMRNGPSDDDPAVGAKEPFQVKFYFELFNPLPAIADPADAARHDAVLSDDAIGAVYKIEIHEQTDPPADVREPDNVDGSLPGPPKLECTDFGSTPTTRTIRPGTGAQNTRVRGNEGFYVISASENPVIGTDTRSTYRTDALSLALAEAPTPEPPAKTYTVLLRRLANPHVAFDALSNPYVTVDYFPGLRAADAVRCGPNPAPAPRAAASRPHPSHGRRGPLVASDSAEQTDSSGQPGFTFFAHNSNVPQAPDPVTGGYFEWLVHPNRPLACVPEVLHVSGFKPHELTQQFGAPGGRAAHRAVWPVAEARIYRALEFFTVGERAVPGGALAPSLADPNWVSHVSVGGRKAGMVNLNTTWDRAVLDALADPNSSNYFSAAQVDAAWETLRRRRATDLGGTGPVDVPFQSLAAPPVPGGDPQYDPDNRALTAEKGGYLTGTFPGAESPNHPAVFQELLAKLANHLTVRSNVFAVYLTIGFFEVVDDTARPVRLGAELRTREGVVLRHKMFAVVDRTALGLDDPDDGPYASQPYNAARLLAQSPRQPLFLTTDSPVEPLDEVSDYRVTIAGGLPNRYEPSAANGSDIVASELAPVSTAGATRYRIVYVDTGTRRERAQVLHVGPNFLDLRFIQPTSSAVNTTPHYHPAGTTVSTIRTGNPGPQTALSTGTDAAAQRYRSVVPLVRIIQ